MHHQTDYCILGAGLAGLSLADALQEQGIDTTVIEKGDIADGASGTPGGLVNPATGRRATKVWKAELCYRAIAENLNKVQGHNPSTPSFYQQSGLLRPALLEKMARKMKEQYSATSWPDGWCRWKSEAEIKEIHPGITCVNGGLWLPIGLAVDVGLYLKSYAQYLSDCGVQIHSHTDTVVRKEHNRWILQSDKIDIRAQNVVFAIGQATKNSYYWDWLTLELIKGQTATFASEKNLDFTHSISSLGYMAQTAQPNTIVQGSTYEHNFSHLEPDDEGEQYLRKRMRRTLPKLEEQVTLADQWAGVRTSTADKKPILGHHPVHPSLHIFSGLGSKGLLYSKFLANHYVNHLMNGIDIFPEVDIDRFNNF